ncbi:FecCD family ABC transporter permease [Paenibacillus radicis (ex Gao et al. 2016)]|uniref:FecCD family ABC transporter permease n=1 Tax=Paenibacillus radicis (ex Gao et al. 2016) TaxID=1737354 RepID=UPI001E64B222|nr:iron ABC transporter permease [Paenibacillus radicis (ex Gao et al. 2016)]
MKTNAQRSGRLPVPSRTVAFIAIFLLALAGVLFSLVQGAVSIHVLDIIGVFRGAETGGTHDIIWNVRFPRTLVAALVGIHLALAGALLQGVMRNPMADPHIIGVSSGAGLTGIAMIVLFPAYSYLMTPAAFIGALIAAGLVYALAWKNGIQPVRLILAGVAVSAFFGSGISAMLVFYSDRVDGALLFLVGGLSAKTWPHFQQLLPYTVIGGISALLLARRMNILALDEQNAKGLGLNVEAARVLVIAVAALLSASAVSVVGLLGFVGMIVPHVTRMLFGHDYRLLLPASALIGISVMTIFDTLSRIIFAPIELPVGILTGAIGAPFFIYLLRKKGSRV